MKIGSEAVCEHGWQGLRRDPMPWLLDECGAGVRWRTLRELVGRPTDSPAVLRARGGANAVDPVASLLDHLQPDGSWDHDVHPWARYGGSGWRLVAAIQLGADPSDPRLRAAAAHLLQTTPGDGGLDPEPCVTARGLQSLAGLGHARDARFEEALAWLEDSAASAGGGWTCSEKSHRAPGGGCRVTSVAVLSTLLAAPEHQRPVMRNRAAAVLGRCLASRSGSKFLFDYGDLNLMRTDAAEIFQVMARSGIEVDAAWVPSLLRLQADQDELGRWKLKDPSPTTRLEVGGGEVGEPSPWVTLRAATAVMLYAVDAGLPRLFPQRPVVTPVGNRP